MTLYDRMCLKFLKNILVLKKKISLKLFWFFFFKIDRITLDPDPNWAQILDPDPNSMYLDP